MQTEMTKLNHGDLLLLDDWVLKHRLSEQRSDLQKIVGLMYQRGSLNHRRESVADGKLVQVHIVRNILRFEVWKDHKVVSHDLKQVYRAAMEECALQAPDAFGKEWDAATRR